MKKVISFRLFIAVFLIVLGGGFMIKGIAANIAISKCKDLQTIQVSEFSKNEYVCGNIDSLLGIESSFSGNGTLYPLCNTDVLSREETYIVRINKTEPCYICVKVKAKFLDKFKNSIEEDLKSNYFLYGKVQKLSGYNESIRDSLNESKQNKGQIIEDGYFIQIVDFEDEKEGIPEGFIVLISGIALLTLIKKISIDERNVSIG